MDALQKIVETEKTNDNKQCIVISELEENAMNDAKKQNDLIINYMNKFIKLIENTNNNFNKIEMDINNEFDSIINSLRLKQKKLLSKLHIIKQEKIDLFNKQINILKDYIKEYDELNNKWNKMLFDDELLRDERKKQIINDSKLTIKKAKQLKNENENIFGCINDTFSVHFEPYKLVKI